MFLKEENFIYDLGEVVMTEISYVDLVTYPEIDCPPSYFFMKCKNGETYKIEVKVSKVN